MDSEPTHWKPGDLVWVENNDWCGSKARCVVEKLFKGGNVRVLDERTGKHRLTHVNNLTRRDQ